MNYGIDLKSSLRTEIMQYLNGLSTLKVDIANNFGNDKVTYKERINWFDNNIKPVIFKETTDEQIVQLLDSLGSKDLEKPLQFVSIQAYRDYLNNKPSGYMVSFDATASGLQLMSLFSNDLNGMILTNCLNPDIRYDIYTELYKITKEVFENKYKNTDDYIDFDRAKIKSAIMVLFYGGTVSVLKHLDGNKKLYDILIKVCKKYIPKAYKTMELLLDSIVGYPYYKWIMPDGFSVITPVITNYTETQHIDGLDGEITIKYKDMGDNPSFKGTAANVIHSFDALVMRELTGRCNYNKNKILEVMVSWINNISKMGDDEYEKYKKTVGHYPNVRLKDYLTIYKETGWLSVRIFDLIDGMNDIVHLHDLSLELGDDYIFKPMLNLAVKLTRYKPFEVIVIHDCFKCLPNNMNIVRFWYAEILQELLQHSAFEYVVYQLPNKHQFVSAFTNGDIGHNDILDFDLTESNYMIC